MKLKGIEDEDVKKGYTICDIADPVKVSNHIQVLVKILELPKSENDQEKIFSKG